MMLRLPPALLLLPTILYVSSAFSTKPLPSTANSIRSKTVKYATSIEDTGKISKNLVDALDLLPLVDNVAKHAGTNRAKNALMYLVEHEQVNNKQTFNANYNNSKRKEMLSSMSGSSSFSGIDGTYKSKYSTRHIVKVAESITEAHEEWEFIKEATIVLKGHKRWRPTDAKPDLPLPPIYGVNENSNPWNLNNDEADTDDDDWLHSILAGFSGPLELQQILQADVVVQRIVGCYDWTKTKQIIGKAPNLAQILNGDIDTWNEIQDEIKGTVVITKGQKSFSDPTGTKSFNFELNEKKFPNLSILKNKEKVLVEETKEIMKRLFANRKYVSKLSGFSRNKPEPYELDGRMVVAAPKEIAQKIGKIRGYSNNGSFCYVEPTEVIQLGNSLQAIREDISSQTLVISNHLSAIIVRSVASINQGLDAVARLDAIFARAAYGYTLNGSIPHIGNDGAIHVENFVHPILAVRGNRGGRVTVPVDLKISSDTAERTLIISGPNGGGKSLAMKSFGLVGMMVKLGLPIPRDRIPVKNSDETRVDFFNNILVELGDHQSLIAGESTYQAHLNTMAKLLERVCPSEQMAEEFESSSLILLDELGGGTDPTAGSCIAQAILEKILENSGTRTIATTHSTQLKALSLKDDRFNGASVQLQAGNSVGTGFRLPTYKLCYGAIGNSYALGAASRSNPSIPDDVLDRAANLIASSEDRRGEYLRTITEALEKEKESLAIATEVTEGYKNDIIRCRDAVLSLAKSYDQHFSKIEGRLDNMLQLLIEDKTKNAYDIVGDSVSTLRLAKKANKSKDDMLRDKGMRVITISDIMNTGDRVVVVAKGDFEGETTFVAEDQTEAAFDELVLNLEFDGGMSLHASSITLKMKRSDLATWDYPSIDEDWDSFSQSNSQQSRSIPDSRNRLLNVLSTLKTSEPKKKAITDTPKKKGGTFMSSRERKAASKKSRKKKK